TVVACSNADDTGQTSSSLSCEATYENFAGPFLLNWCVGCHSSSLPEGKRQMAPLGVNFDTLGGVRAHADLMRSRVVDLQSMPPVGGPSQADRELFGQWIDCGMPAQGEGFDPPPPPPMSMDAGTIASGTCAEPRAPLSTSLLPRCKAATLECIVQCGLTSDQYNLDACRNACLAADGTPAASASGFAVDCPTCTLLQLLACADTGGCHEETAAFICCIEACGGSDTCASTQCSGELSAFGLCVYYSAPDCVDYDKGPMNACFATSDGDGGNGGASGAGGAGGAG
ncbi:MAG TPA: hypothetical protein VGP93_19945, partial [Polyangiaceae bacterium]|nr:hypothetical protein [Polyangiaceae bacterium]